MHSDDTFKTEFAKAWRMMLGFGKVHAEIGSTDFKIWLKSCREFTSEQIWVAVRKVQDHKGYLDLAQFREYCRPEIVKASHRLFLPEKQEKKLKPEEIREKIAEIRATLNM
jgi:hypothetical protein